MVNLEEQKIKLMAYLDGELGNDEREEFEKILMESPELQDDLAKFQKLKTIVGSVRIPEPKPELWDELPRRSSEKASRGLGWVLLIIGISIIAIYLVYMLWWNETLALALKIGISALAAGFIILLGSVIERRRQEKKTDRYKEIIR